MIQQFGDTVVRWRGQRRNCAKLCPDGRWLASVIVNNRVTIIGYYASRDAAMEASEQWEA